MHIPRASLFAGVFSSLIALSPVVAALEPSVPSRALGSQDAVVPVIDEPGHIVRYRSPHFVVYTNHFAPGKWTLYHEHRNDLLAVIAGDTVAISQKLGSDAGQQQVPAGTVAFFPYADMPNGYIHRVSVGGTLPFINIGVDFQDAAPNADRRASLPLWDAKNVSVIAENRRGRAYRAELTPGKSLVLPEYGSAILLVTLGKADLTLGAGGEASRWESVQGDFRFFEKTWPHDISNASSGTTSVLVFQAY